jgi:hypothetical protein
MKGADTIVFSTLRLPGFVTANYTVTCESRPRVTLSERSSLSHLLLPLAELAADSLQGRSHLVEAYDKDGDPIRMTALWAVLGAVVGVGLTLIYRLCHLSAS